MEGTNEVLSMKKTNNEKTIEKNNENNDEKPYKEHALIWYDRLHKHDAKLKHKRSQSRVMINFCRHLPM
jgi:hypothetical protein